MSCIECTHAAQRLHHGFAAGCRGCAARAAARSPEFDQARRTGRLDVAYRALLEAMGVTHDEAKAAREVDALSHRTTVYLGELPVR